MGSRGASSGISASYGGAPSLSAELIRRANAAGTVVDYGDSTARQYRKNVDEINTFTTMTETEKKAAYSELHDLTENQLRAEAKAVGPYTSGPARFNKSKVTQNADNAATARQKTNSFMDGLRNQEKARIQASKATDFRSAAQAAIKAGALEFTVNGETWRRKSTRGKSFIKVR